MNTRPRTNRADKHTSSDPATDAGQTVLLVAACAGPRCAALRHLDSANPAHDDGNTEQAAAETDAREPAEHPYSDAAVRVAIRQRPDAVLLRVPCLGPCHQASLTAVGRGITGPGDHTLNWLGHPTLLTRTDLPARARALADWITGPAPDALPETLNTDGAQP